MRKIILFIMLPTTLNFRLEAERPDVDIQFIPTDIDAAPLDLSSKNFQSLTKRLCQAESAIKTLKDGEDMSLHSIIF